MIENTFVNIQVNSHALDFHHFRLVSDCSRLLNLYRKQSENNRQNETRDFRCLFKKHPACSFSSDQVIPEDAYNIESGAAYTGVFHCRFWRFRGVGGRLHRRLPGRPLRPPAVGRALSHVPRGDVGPAHGESVRKVSC